MRLDHGCWNGVHRIYGHTVLCVFRWEVIRLNSQLAVGGRGLTEGPVAVLWRHLLTMTRHHVVTVLGHISGEGDHIYRGRSAVMLSAPPGLPLDLLLSKTTAGSTERGTEHDGQAEAQHGHKDLKNREVAVHQQPGSSFRIRFKYCLRPDLSRPHLHERDCEVNRAEGSSTVGVRLTGQCSFIDCDKDHNVDKARSHSYTKYSET